MLPAPPPRSSRATWLARRAAVGTAGGALCSVGLVMMVLPGPGVLMLFLGLAVLATEFAWARQALERIRLRAVEAVNHLRANRTARIGVMTSAAVLIVGGTITAMASQRYQYLGASTVVAGIAGLGVLVPAVQRFVLGPTPDISTDTGTAEPAS